MRDQDVPVTAGSQVTEIIIPVPGSHARFQGYLIREVSSRTDEDQLRFTVIRLYRVADEKKPETQYLISVIGKSVVYHVHKSRCGMGVEHAVGSQAVQDIWDDLTECPKCRPRAVEYMRDDELIDLEMDRVNPIRECKDAEGVRKRLEQPQRDENGIFIRNEHGDVVMFLSAPAERLLRIAALTDAGIAAEIEKVEDL